MAYEQNVLRRATERLEDQRRRREDQQNARRREIYAAVPRVAEIDRQLRRTISGGKLAGYRRVIARRLARGRFHHRRLLSKPTQR